METDSSRHGDATSLVIRNCKNHSGDVEEFYVLVTYKLTNISFLVTNGASCWDGNVDEDKFAALFKSHVTREESEDGFRAILSGADKNFDIAAETVGDQKELTWWEGDFGLGFTVVLRPVEYPLQKIGMCIAATSGHVALLWDTHSTLCQLQTQLKDDIQSVRLQKDQMRACFTTEHSKIIDEMTRVLNREKRQIASLKESLKKKETKQSSRTFPHKVQKSSDACLDNSNAYNMDMDENSDADGNNELDPVIASDAIWVPGKDCQNVLQMHQHDVSSTTESLPTPNSGVSTDDDGGTEWEM